jgi:hypothetical protein
MQTAMKPWISSQPSEFTPGDGVKKRLRTIARILKIVYIIYSIEVGIFLIWLPWMSFWDTNYLTHLFPQIHQVLANPFFKGAVLGLGIANIMIGIHEVIHFRKFSKSVFTV